jgi:hypothetical protein
MLRLDNGDEEMNGGKELTLVIGEVATVVIVC